MTLHTALITGLNVVVAIVAAAMCFGIASMCRNLVRLTRRIDKLELGDTER